MKGENVFTREDTKAIKGIAVILMLAHHIFLFDDRIPVGYEIVSYLSINDIAVNKFIGHFGSICVPIFMFLGGYGLYKQFQLKEYDLWQHIFNLYKAYWKVFVIFVPIGFLFFSNQPQYCVDVALCNAYSQFELTECISNLIGWTCSYNREWWFFKTYLCTVFLGYICVKNVNSKRGVCTETLAVIIFQIFIRNVFPAICNIAVLDSLKGDAIYTNLFLIQQSSSVFFMGIIFAKYDEIEFMKMKLEQVGVWTRMFVCVAGIFVIAYARLFLIDNVLDIVYVPCFIVLCLEIMDIVPAIKKCFVVLGKNSTNMWLIHSFYCYYFFKIAKIVFWSKNAIVDLVVLILLSLVSSVALEYMYQGVKKLYGRRLRRIVP